MMEEGLVSAATHRRTSEPSVDLGSWLTVPLKNLVASILQDFRFFFRLLVQNPILNGVALACLALGIGATAAVFCLVDALLLRPVPMVQAPDEVVRLFGVSTSTPDRFQPISWADYVDYQKSGSRLVSGLAATAACDVSLISDGPAERIPALAVSDSYFSLLGLKPALGRFFSSGEENGERIAVLGHDLWRRSFAADPRIVGKKIRLNGKVLTVVGVAPKGFSGVDLSMRREIWFPLGIYSEVTTGVLAPFSGRQDRQQAWLDVIGRLHPGVGLREAQSGFAVAARNLATAYPDTNEKRDVRLLPLREVVLGVHARPEIERYTKRLMAAMTLVLCVAALNLAGLLFARTINRRREIGIRLSLGCSRGRLARQFLAEGLLLGILGAAAGLLLATFALPLLKHLHLPAELSLRDLRISWRVVGFAFLVATGCSIAFALAPILQTLRFDAAAALAAAHRPCRRAGIGPREILVSCQLALAFPILLAAGLMVRTIFNIVSIDPGFDPKNVLTAAVDLSSAGYQESQASFFYDQLLTRVRSLPEAKDASMVSALPVMGGGVMVDLSVTVDHRLGEPSPASLETPLSVRHVLVGDRYFETVGAHLRRGRFFDKNDLPTGQGVAVLNETAARQLWSDGSDPVHQRIRLVQTNEPFEVVGVVGDTTYSSLKEQRTPMLYLYHPQAGKSFIGQALAPEMTLLVRGKDRNNFRDTLSAFRNVVYSADKRLPVFRVGTLEDSLAATVATERQSVTLYSFLALVTISLALLGLYGAVTHTISTRIRELGIRVACGADPLCVLKHLFKYSFALVLSGLFVGLLLAVPINTLLAGQLFGINPYDVLTWSATACALLVFTLAIAAVPSFRAAKMNPAVALRYD
jgi:putative ABC transport system permease protein